MMYQFFVDGRAAGPMRRIWEEAAWDAVNAGYAIWIDHGEIKIDTNMGASIERVL